MTISMEHAPNSIVDENRIFSTISSKQDIVKNTGNMKNMKNIKNIKRYKHDIDSYNNAILKCNKNEKRALRIFETMIDWKIKPDLLTFNCLINVCNKSNNLSLCWDLFNRMTKKYQIFPNHQTYQILFGSMFKQKHYDDIIKQFDKISNEYKYNKSDETLKIIYQILPYTLISYSKLNKIEICKDLFYEWFNEDLFNKLPQNSIINAIISILTTNNDVDEAIELLIKYNSYYTDNRAYISILKSLQRLNDNDDKLIKIYNLALKNSSNNNNNKSIDIFNIMLTQCINNKNWKLSNKIWNDLQSLKIKPDSITYIEYIQCIVYSLKLKKIPEIINEIISKQEKENEKLITQKLSSCMMWSIIETIRNYPYLYNESTFNPYHIFKICKYDFNILPNTDMFNELLYFSLKFLNYKQALNILDEMKQLNLRSDIRTFNIFISGLGKLKRIDLIQQLLQQIDDLDYIEMNGSTFMNLFDAFAQNGEIQLITKYFHLFVNDTSGNFYIDKICYGHLINCYANYFKYNHDNNHNLEFISDKLNDCLIYWNILKNNQKLYHSLGIDDYILILKCIKNYIININTYCSDNDNDKYIFKLNEMKEFVIDLFENDILKLIKDCNNNNNNNNTIFNILLDILYETKQYELGLKYFEMAESMNIYSTLHKFDDNKGNFDLDLHEMRSNPAIFAIIHYLNLLKKINVKQNVDFEIITGIGQTSIDWKPILKPLTMNLLDKRLSHSISYYAPSYNQGVLILDHESLEMYFKSTKPLILKY